MAIERLIRRLKWKEHIGVRRLQVKEVFNDMPYGELEEVVDWLLEDDGSLPHLERALKECGYRL